MKKIIVVFMLVAILSGESVLAYGGGTGITGGSTGSATRVGSRNNIPAEPSVPQGQVLGASTTCGEYLSDYLRMGWNNNPEEVKKLQTFLNEYMGANLPVTGFFGPMTLEAVNAFQLKESNTVLTPWVNAGLHDSAAVSTGFVYKTTKAAINRIKCPDLNLSVPQVP